MARNNAREGYKRCTKWDKKMKDLGWEKVHGEHRYFAGGFPHTCNIAGFDRLYMTSDGPVLVEICDAGHHADHKAVIVARLKERPLLTQCFKIALVIYYGGNKKLHSTTKERKWTKAGTWTVEWFN